ncbi:MAG: hypothetical protein JWM02_2600 [Frankiales bacterium]|nr:hypothetical protein [Frankiales bacterium]
MSVLLVLDLLGVAVFAVSGAELALDKQLDLFGVLVLAAVTALGGGVLRDLLLGATPPAVLKDGRFLVVALATGLIVFAVAPQLPKIVGPVRLFDAAGLGLFVAAGTTKALSVGLGAVPAVTVGCITGIGGGIARDVLVGVVPVVLRRELYAVPAVLGASVVTMGDGLHLNPGPTAAVGALLVFTVRMLGIWRDWHFPVGRR